MIFKKEKVLVCDDQPMLRQLLTNAINDYSAKFEVVQAENGAEAEEILRNDSFSFIFLDVEMPEQDGFTTLQRARREACRRDLCRYVHRLFRGGRPGTRLAT